MIRCYSMKAKIIGSLTCVPDYTRSNMVRYVLEILTTVGEIHKAFTTETMGDTRPIDDRKRVRGTAVNKKSYDRRNDELLLLMRAHITRSR